MPNADTIPKLPSLDDLTAELESALAPALAARWAGSAGDARAAARQVIEGKGMPPEWRERLGAEPAVTLVSFDADRIQGWVFSSERVQVASGASLRLDGLNQEARDLDRKVAEVTGLVYSAGGGGMLFAEPGCDLKQLAAAVKSELESDSDGLTFTVEAVPLYSGDLEATPDPQPAGERSQVVRGVGGALARSQVLVRRRKEESPALPPAGLLERVPGRPAERCSSCRVRPPQGGGPVTGDDPKSWCGPCLKRRRFWKKKHHLAQDDSGPVPTFEEFAEANRGGRPYLAFLAIDGNAMGGLVQRMRSFLELRAFSEATTAIFDAARARIPELLRDGGFLQDGQNPDDSYLSLLSGGDEITVVLPSSAAPSVAVALLRAIETGYQDACKVDGLLGRAFAGHPDLLKDLRQVGAGAGLVVAPGTYPVRLLRRYAQDLQKEAKSFCAAPGAAGPRGTAGLPGAAGAPGAPEAPADARRSGLAWTLLTDSSPLTRRSALVAGDDLSLAAFDRLLKEVRAAAEHRLPASALRRVLDTFRREEDVLRSLLGDADGRRTAARVTANFLRYQVARSGELAAWWRQVAPADPDDPAFAWLVRQGADGLQRLLDLHSLAPVPQAGPAAAEPAAAEVAS